MTAITGGPSGNDLAIAHYLAAHGPSHSLADIDQEDLDAASEAVQKDYSGTEVLITVIDAHKAKQIVEWIRSTAKEFGDLANAANLASVFGKSMGVKTVGERDDGVRLCAWS